MYKYLSIFYFSKKLFTPRRSFLKIHWREYHITMETKQASRTGRSLVMNFPSVQLPGGNIVHEVKSACKLIWTNFSANLSL